MTISWPAKPGAGRGSRTAGPERRPTCRIWAAIRKWPPPGQACGSSGVERQPPVSRAHHGSGNDQRRPGRRQSGRGRLKRLCSVFMIISPPSRWPASARTTARGQRGPLGIAPWRSAGPHQAEVVVEQGSWPRPFGADDRRAARRRRKALADETGDDERLLLRSGTISASDGDVGKVLHHAERPPPMPPL